MLAKTAEVGRDDEYAMTCEISPVCGLYKPRVSIAQREKKKKRKGEDILTRCLINRIKSKR